MRGQPGVAVDGLPTSGPDLEVQVGPGGLTRAAHVPDVLPCGDPLTDGDIDTGGPHVDVSGRDRMAVDGVVDDDMPAPRLGVFGELDDPVGHRVDGRAIGGCVIGAFGQGEHDPRGLGMRRIRLA